MTHNVLDRVIHTDGSREETGITSVCSANPMVLAATLDHAHSTGQTILIESTCNQVNQYGGYTAMTPSDFMAFVTRFIEQACISPQQVIIGGDHLGPNPWRRESSAVAMDKARVLVRDVVLAGYKKIHLDASMRCADDVPNGGLDPRMAARRTAALAAVAEEAFERLDSRPLAPRYVIGTEVPPPGGIEGGEAEVRVTPVWAVQRTIELTRQAFAEQGLEAAWDRVIAVVVQPGVEYGNQTIHDYDRAAAAALSDFVEGVENLVYEAHSTDYQRREALRQLVEDHFSILKVGPALTFALRESVYALSFIEDEWLGRRGDVELSNIRGVLDRVMVADPRYWSSYYTGPPEEQAFARRYSLSDRSRYYWTASDVQEALGTLMLNLSTAHIPLSLLSQFMPNQYQKIRDGELVAAPRALLMDSIAGVLADYTYACHKTAECS